MLKKPLESHWEVGCHPDHGICTVSVIFPLETHQYCFSIVFYSSSQCYSCNERCYIWSIVALIRCKAFSRWCSDYALSRQLERSSYASRVQIARKRLGYWIFFFP